MRHPQTSGLPATALIAGLLSALLAGCGGDSTTPSAAGSPAAPTTGAAPTSAAPSGADTDAPSGSVPSCGPEATATDSASVLPANLPAVPGGTAYRHDTIGSTTVEFVRLEGDAGDLVKIRDQAVDALKGAGYTIKRLDQEPGAEAEAEFGGPHEGTVNVRVLCAENVVVRYKIEG